MPRKYYTHYRRCSDKQSHELNKMAARFHRIQIENGLDNGPTNIAFVTNKHENYNNDNIPNHYMYNELQSFQKTQLNNNKKQLDNKQLDTIIKKTKIIYIFVSNPNILFIKKEKYLNYIETLKNNYETTNSNYFKDMSDNGFNFHIINDKIDIDKYKLMNSSASSSSASSSSSSSSSNNDYNSEKVYEVKNHLKDSILYTLSCNDNLTCKEISKFIETHKIWKNHYSDIINSCYKSIKQLYDNKLVIRKQSNNIYYYSLYKKI